MSNKDCKGDPFLIDYWHSNRLEEYKSMKEKPLDYLALTKREKLLLHNLQTRKYWSEKIAAELGEGQAEESQDTASKLPALWRMTKGITLHGWQQDCVDKWLEHKRGTIKVVTGGGKTILALAIIEALQTLNPELRVAIVVPTIVLQTQWYKEIMQNSNLPHSAIGRLGGGHNDGFNQNTRILLCVINSAASRLASHVKKSEVGSGLLLIVDECHRAGAPDMRRVFETERAYNLGLSATPEREDVEEDTNAKEYASSLLGQELGPIIYEMTVHQAFEQGILPAFEIHHYGLPLSVQEREKYENLSRRLRDVTAELREQGHKYGIHDSAITRRTQHLAARKDELGRVARQHIFLTNERKRLLYNANSRLKAVIGILKREFDQDPDTRSILFHESIDSVMDIYHRLLQEGFPVAVEHSKLPEGLRDESIALFRQGVAQVIVSARSLIEGFNVPETDIGIIVASSTSVRQRIQSIGRLLRKGKDGHKVARIYVLYVRDTVDEIIYGKTDWDDLLGAERNRYYLWQEDGELVEQPQAPRAPLPDEDDIAPDSLKIGDEYPGGYEGAEYSCDSEGNVFTRNREIIVNPQGCPELVRRVKGSYGKFKVTPKKRYILVLVHEHDDWIVKYAGQLQEPFELAASQEQKSAGVAPKKTDLEKLQPGDLFPHQLVGKKPETIYLRQRRGRFVLARKMQGGERYARVGEHARDRGKGDDAARLLAICREIKGMNPRLSKLLITEQNHVVFLKEGQYYYLYTLRSGLEFA